MQQRNRRVIKFDQEARQSLKNGADKLANIVKSTLGPSGSNVIIGVHPTKVPKITNDGVSIAKEVHLEDEIEDLGARTIRDVAIQANEIAGDGTTTAITLAQAIIKEGFDKMQTGVNLSGVSTNSMQIKREIDTQCKTAIEELKKMAKPVKSKEDLTQVAFVSSEDKEIADAVVDTFWKVGKQGHLVCQESFSSEIETEIVDGFNIDAGYASSFMVNNDKLECVINKANILITNHVIHSIVGDDGKWLISICNNLAQRGIKELVLVAMTYSDPVLGDFYINTANGTFKILAIRAPLMFQKYLLEDLAVFTGGKFINSELTKLADIKVSDLGFAEKVVSTGNTTTVFKGKGTKEAIELAKKNLKSLAKEEKTQFHKNLCADRMKKLDGLVGVIKVGASTDAERKYKFDKVEDTINAVRAAWEEGVVPGGGLALKSIADKMKDGFLKNVLSAPYNQIQINAGGNLEIPDSVVDPVKVTRVALEKACSIAGTFITTVGAINVMFEKKEEVNNPVAENEPA